MIHTIDLNFQNVPEAIAVFLIETADGPVLVESGPHSTFPQLTTEINKLGYEVKDIKHVFLTHIHFDHAGAAWAFAEQGAKIYVHPKGYKHMHDPSKLVSSAKRIYQEMMEPLWGTLKPIDESNLIEMEDHQVVSVNDAKFTAHFTPGHAVHHIAWQLNDKTIFCGDVAGVKIKDGLVVPPCPPPDINVEDWMASIEKIRSLNMEEIYLTHFGKVTGVKDHLLQLETMLNSWADWIKPYYEAGASVADTVPKFQEFTKNQLIEFGVPKEDFSIYEAANPSWMSVSGLMRYWKKREEAA